MKIIFKLILGITVLVMAIAVGPLLILWALNTLFPVLAIPYTWQTWAAAFILSSPFSAGAFSRSKKS